MDRNVRLTASLILPLSSLSARRAWIEIARIVFVRLVSGSLSARRAWIEIIVDIENTSLYKSLSARRAWIEIQSRPINKIGRLVALRKESVDRNAR